MRLPWSTGILAALLLLLQADLWLGKGNLRYVWQLQLQLAETAAPPLAALAAFLLGPDAGWITGQLIGVDGGLSRLR